jgi:asparagine synthase (glutamine-hydrolysing)
VTVCGIAGTLGARDATLATSMTHALRHRGPDSTGYHTGAAPDGEGPLHLGFARLSIIDVSGGRQPISNETGTICAVVNGEIYNYRELRGALAARGHRFTTGSDSEVVVHLYEEHGDRCVDHLQGMFAFAVADGSRLLLARDRLGIKPLYYTIVPGGDLLLFASEIKALLRCPGVRPELDLQAFADSVVLAYEVGDRTPFAGIRCLPPGHTMSASLGPEGLDLRHARYYEMPSCPAAAVPAEAISPDAAADRLLELLRATVRSHLVSDVEVGLMLSGGLDSAILAVLMREITGRPFRAFSVADHPDHPDAVQATRIAASLGCPHDVVAMTFRDYLSAIPGYVRAEERPTGLGGGPLYLLYRHIGADLKVCLDGEGADELFGGYPEYSGKSFRGRYAVRKLGALKSLGVAPSARALEIIDTLAVDRPAGDYLRRLFPVNLQEQLVNHHLESLDKTAMASGLEMRVPYMDHELVAYATALPVELKVDAALQIQKSVLKRAALKLCGAAGPLVDSVLRPKIGAPSAGSRHRERLDQLCDRALPEDYLTRHELGFCFSSKRELLVFELFQEIFLHNRGALPDDLSVLELIRQRARRPALCLD